MTKDQVIANMAASAGITKVQAKEALNSFLNSVEETLSNKDSLQLKGFGTFKTVEKAERNGRNPATGASMVIPAKTSAKLTFSAELVNKINNK